MTDSQERPIRAYFGHHKCASTWISEILAHVSREVGLRHLLVTDLLTPHGHGPLRDYGASTSGSGIDRSMLRARAEGVGADVVSCVTADRRQLDVLRPYRGVHVIRDPRDILVSAYFWHRGSHPENDYLPHFASHREALGEASFADGLFLEMEFSEQELRDIADWNYDDDRILELKQEDIVRQPYESCIAMFRHLDLLAAQEPVTGREHVAVWSSRLRNRLATRWGLETLRRKIPVTGDLLLGTVYARRFEAKTKGRARGSEDVHSHYRKGVPGDWANHFTAEHAELFDQKYGDLLMKLGFEQDHSWVDRQSSMCAAA